jgi:hypothetical protein
MHVVFAFSFLGLSLTIGIVLALNPEWLEDKEPDSGGPVYRPHRPSRVVRAAPEREDVTA